MFWLFPSCVPSCENSTLFSAAATSVDRPQTLVRINSRRSTDIYNTLITHKTICFFFRLILAAHSPVGAQFAVIAPQSPHYFLPTKSALAGLHLLLYRHTYGAFTPFSQSIRFMPTDYRSSTSEPSKHMKHSFGSSFLALCTLSYVRSSLAGTSSKQVCGRPPNRLADSPSADAAARITTESSFKTYARASPLYIEFGL